MPYTVVLDPSAAKFLKKIDEVNKTRIKKTLSQLADNPYTAGEPINPSDYWKIKTGDYRSIYEINEETKQVIVLYVGHRKNVYDNFSKLI